MNIFASGIGSAGTIHRDGNILVVPSGGCLPATCVKCGTPVSGKPLTMTFRWHSSWLYLLILPGLLFYVIAVLAVQKKARVDVPFCEAHRSWRIRMNVAGAVLLIGSVPASLLLGAFDIGGGVVALMAVAMAFSGAVVLAIVGSSLAPVYIDETCVRLKGAGEQFLSSLPSSPVSPYR
jgi:hypothetical protein